MRPLLPLIGLLALCAGTLALTGAAQSPASTQTRQFTLYVREGQIPMPDGTQMYVWGFTDEPGGQPRIPGPPIVVNEGDTVEIKLVNDLDPTTSERLPAGEGHTIHLHGLDTTMENDGVPETHGAGLVRQGESFTYRFTASHAGTYFYHCHQNNVEHQQMGMYGPLIVRSANGANTAYTGGPAFDREYTLTLSEMGSAGHEQARRAVKSGADPYNWLSYTPNYYFVNGTATAGARGTQSTLEAKPGERILARVINAGYVAQRVDTHGQMFQIVATDGRPWAAGPAIDNLWIGPGEKYDLLFVAGQAGTIQLETNGGQPYAGPAAIGKEPSAAAPDSGEVRRYTLYVRDGQVTMPDGVSVYVYGYTDAPSGSASGRGPLLAARAGDTIDLTLVNDRDPSGAGVGFRVLGLDAATEGRDRVAPGETGNYRFRVPRAGTFWYTDPTDVAHQKMGMYGAVVVSPSDGSNTVYAGGPAFDQQYTMVLSEMDSVAQGAVQSSGGQPSASSSFTPNYFLINGLAYPDTEANASTMVHAQPGDRVLIRVINAGQVAHAMHLHGYHFDVVASGGNVVPNPPRKDTVLVAPGETYDLLFVADQPGMFPFHDHFETANTNNGVWLGGMHTMVATGVDHAAATQPAVAAPAADGPAVAVRDNFYTPNQLTVPLGTTVRWDNQGRSEHTVSSLLGYFDSGTLRAGDTFSYTFTAPGRYDYFCRFHITNRGIVVVE